MRFGITVHTIVCNEENWVWYALMAIKDRVDKVLVYDTGSTDKTVDAIKAIHDTKITFEQKGPVSASKLVELRQQQIDRTATPWILLVDGDEVWDNCSLDELIRALREVPASTWGVVVRTRNCVGDIYHVMPDSFGKYRIGDVQGHMNLRVLRNLKGLRVGGKYPDEAFYPNTRKSLQVQPQHLMLLPASYWHMTHVSRSTQDPHVSGRRKKLIDLGKAVLSDTKYPEVFSMKSPPCVPSPWQRRSFAFTAAAVVVTPLRRVKVMLDKVHQ